MYSLVWQSVMWRPGKLRFLIGVKNPLPIRPAVTARKHGPLRGPRRSPDSRLQSGYALLSSRIRRQLLILIDASFSSRLSRSSGFTRFTETAPVTTVERMLDALALAHR